MEAMLLLHFPCASSLLLTITCLNINLPRILHALHAALQDLGNVRIHPEDTHPDATS